MKKAINVQISDLTFKDIKEKMCHVARDYYVDVSILLKGLYCFLFFYKDK